MMDDAHRVLGRHDPDYSFNRSVDRDTLLDVLALGLMRRALLARSKE